LPPVLENLHEILASERCLILALEITSPAPDMAIPLRSLRSLDENSQLPRSSMDSEASAILSYALGKHPHTADTDSDDPDDSPRPSSEHEDSEDFFKENDPLTSDYEPALNPRKQVIPFFRGVDVGSGREDFEYV
jgi:hypothetical protein